MESACADFDGAASPDRIRVLIVTDVRLYRDGLARLLGEAGAVEVLGTSAPGEEFFASLTELRPRVVLADSTVARTRDFVARVTASSPGAEVVAFAVAEQNDEEILACAEAGVDGFVGQEARIEELMEVLRVAAQGNVGCSPRVTSVVIRRMAALASSRQPSPARSCLTRREHEIVSLIELGLSNKEIATRLHVSPSTVKNHIHSLLWKLGVRRRFQAPPAIRASHQPFVPSPRQAISA